MWAATRNPQLFEEEESARSWNKPFALTAKALREWEESETAHRQLRDEALRDIRFPFATPRGPARKLYSAVYRRVRLRRAC